MDIQEGQTATNPKTGQRVIFRGGQWVNAGMAPGKVRPLSVQDNNALNGMRGENSAALSVNRDYRDVARTLDRTNWSPAYAKWLDMWVPEEKGGGIMDTLGGLIGAPFLSNQTVTDFQNLKGLQSKRVMDAQIAQKGPETEADAARLQLAEVSPFKTKQANVQLMRRGMADATLAKMKLPFFQKWAGKYGLNGLNEKGISADQAWRGVADATYKAGDRLEGVRESNTASGPQPGQVVKGYRFKGGNPADQNSWERVK